MKLEKNNIPKVLLSKGVNNAKLAKNEFETYILYLSPYTLNSRKVNLCPKASKGCAAACLFSAGRGKFSNVKNARIRKTEYFLQFKNMFIRQLFDELEKVNKKALKQDKTIYVRLNGTSDLDFIKMLKSYAQSLEINFFSHLSNLHFYDYTKELKRIKRYQHEKKYTITFSLSEKKESILEAKDALMYGSNVAVVFNELPINFLGAEVLDGDKSDLVMINNKAKILGLKAKGDAKKDKSGFVRFVTSN